MLHDHDIHTNAPVELSSQDLHSGSHIIGAKGHGKSTLLDHLIASLIESGEGLCVLDPHEEITIDDCELIPEHKRNDAILLDPMHEDAPFGLDLYSCNNPT